MIVLYALVPLALVLAAVAVAGFRWAVRDGQFDDVETPALRILLDDLDEAPEPSAPPSSGPHHSHSHSVQPPLS